MTNVSRLWFRYRYTKCRSVKNLCGRDIKIEKLSSALNNVLNKAIVKITMNQLP